MRRWTLALLIVAAACSSSEDPEPVSTTRPPTTAPSTTTAVPTTVATTPTTAAPIATPPPTRDELAVAAARRAVLDAAVMSAEFAETSVATVNDLGDSLEIILLPANPDTLGATAIVILDAADLSLVQINHYR